MITSGFEDGKFYIDFESCSRPVGNMREEADRRAVELYSSSQNLLLGLSGGLDSQGVLHSFMSQGIPLETVFFYSPGYNDNELENVRFLDKKYGITTQVVDLDPVALRPEIEELTEKYDFPLKNNALQMKFLEQVPKHYDFIQMCLDPFIYINPASRKFYYYQGYYLTMMSRLRCFSHLNRTGKNIMYGWTPEFLTSVITDDIYLGALRAATYFDGNGVKIPLKSPRTLDRWDMYIKPILYGKYWGEELEYFPKYAGFEKLEWILVEPRYKAYYVKKHAMAIPYFEFVDFLKLGTGKVKRYYENITPDMDA
jgi:hypothetical protein